jgi:uncharacterized protein (TIGR03067 family)
MNWKWLPALLVVGLLVAADDKKEDAKKDKEKLTGTWTVVSATQSGKEAENAKDGTVVFEGDNITATVDGKEHKLTFKIDPDKKPKTIDLTPSDGPEKDKVHEGIYSLEKDELKICFAKPGAERPKEFESKEGSEIMLIVLKKSK